MLCVACVINSNGIVYYSELEEDVQENVGDGEQVDDGLLVYDGVTEEEDDEDDDDDDISDDDHVS